MPVRRRLRLAGIIILSTLAVAALGVAVLLVAVRKPRPTGVPGPAATELARAIERAVHKQEWDRTGAVRWTFAGAHHHLWDRQRSLARVRWGKNEVLLDTGKADGRAYHEGAEVQGPARRKLVADAYSYWINDSFWLNPLAKLFDDGVERLVVQQDGQPALLIRYGGGGLTPGDSYLWLLGADGRPRAWRMWVSILPVGGVETTWEGWTTLSTGAVVATAHRVLGLTLRLGDVAGAATLAELEPGADPFAALAGGR